MIPGNVWLVSSAIYDLAAPFKIDQHIMAITGPACAWCAFERRQYFGRRALNVAIEAAADEAGNSAAALEENRTIERQATAALAGVDALIRYLDPQEHGTMARPLEILAAAHNRAAADEAGKKIDVRANIQAARADAATLYEARNVLLRVAWHAEAKGDAIAQDREAVGATNNVKRAFVFRLAQAWASLTGRLPPAARDPERNAFLRLVSAAWIDAGQPDDGGFARALEWVRNSEGEHALTAACVTALFQQGPDWK